MDDSDEEVTRLAIRQAFEAEDQYTETVPPHDTDRVAQLRRLGRAVARELDWKVHTAAVRLQDGATQVVLVITESHPLRDQAMHAKRQRTMRDVLRNL